MMATAAVGAAGSAAGNLAVQAVTSFLGGSFNPNYKKLDQKRMRYIQQKYSLAYGGGQNGEDPFAIIQKIDSNSKLIMSPDGVKPANPFADERAFEDSLIISFHPVSGHEGRFVASHALACLGVIVEYQNQRRRRPWVPGVSSPGRPNDYINMFLEETKTWLKTQLTLDNVHADELAKRELFYTKLKNDDYYWCFPSEGEYRGIHRVIDYVHNKVKDAHEVISREEKNKSLQVLFKELNDHTTNAFEFSKTFLAYLLCHARKTGTNIYNNPTFDGRSLATGKLHYLLKQTTDVVFQTYSDDVALTNERLKPTGDHRAIGNGGRGSGMITDYSPGMMTLTNGPDGNNYGSKFDGDNDNEYETVVKPMTPTYEPGKYGVDISDYEESSFSGISYYIELRDPKEYQWLVRKTYAEFEALHKAIAKEISKPGDFDEEVARIQLPLKVGGMFPKRKDHLMTGDLLCRYLYDLLNIERHSNNRVEVLISKFAETKYLLPVARTLVLKHAENAPNLFVLQKDNFTAQLMIKRRNSIDNKPPAKNGGLSGMLSRNFSGRGRSKSIGGSDVKDDDNESEYGDNSQVVTSNTDSFSGGNLTNDMILFRKTWGVEGIIKIFEAYAHLQRMATILGWTLEINHFFVSMFGNTLAFSKLPLKDILMTLKDVLNNFLTIANDLFAFACKVHADQKYKWHKNLQMTENELVRVRYHIERAIATITLIDSDHLDYEAQMRRLRDVGARFAPLMNRVDGSLTNIQSELQLSYQSQPPQQARITQGNSPESHLLQLQNQTHGQLTLENGPSYNNRNSSAIAPGGYNGGGRGSGPIIEELSDEETPVAVSHNQRGNHANNGQRQNGTQSSQQGRGNRSSQNDADLRDIYVGTNLSVDQNESGRQNHRVVSGSDFGGAKMNDMLGDDYDRRLQQAQQMQQPLIAEAKKRVRTSDVAEYGGKVVTAASRLDYDEDGGEKIGAADSKVCTVS